MSDLTNFWTLDPHAQDKVMAPTKPKPRYLRPKGCKCKKADAHCCWEQKNHRLTINPSDVCACACHVETGGFD